MKFLIIGIDGADERIVRAMPMPFMQSLLKSNTSIKLTEDLWSRGWAEILSGQTGHETGAFYSKPKLMGKHSFTQQFNSNDLIENKSIVPLWEVAMRAGHKIGFMNIPSTIPAPENNGFFVSGGGGGLSLKGVKSFPAGVAQPEAVTKYLETTGYIFDIRFMANGIRETDAYFNALEKMTEKRTSIFIELARHNLITFGFIAYMALNRLQNIAMSEVEALISNECSTHNYIQEQVLKFYSFFDLSIKKLFESLAPEHFIFTADHGQAPYLKNINLNDFLEKQGFLATRPIPFSTAQWIKSSIKRNLSAVLPDKFRFKYFKKKLNPIQLQVKDFIWIKTKAFGVRYVPGIYINDERFHGNVNNDEAAKIVDLIINIFNADPIAQANKLYAIRYRDSYPKAKFNDCLPDIWIKHDDTFFFVETGNYIENYSEYGSIRSLWRVTRDMFTGIKGTHPLFFLDIGIAQHIRKDDPHNLTAVYNIIERALQ